MILDPVNDRECLGQLVVRARELAGTLLAYDVAARLRTVENVIRHLQSLPQADDDGSERVQLLECDMPQRLRFLPPAPNCFERTLAALVLLQIIDPKTDRVPVTVDEPERHTGVVERTPGGDWQALDLFPRRNAGGRRRPKRNAGDQEVAKTILKQLGPVTLAMLGAYDLVASTDGVQFGIKGSPKKITRVAISLAPDDTYTVEFYKGRGLHIGKAAEYELVYVDQLHELIKSTTGLDTTLGGRRQTARRPRRNNTVQDVMGVVHPIGGGILSAFGLGGVAKDAGRLEQQQGWLRRDPPASQTQYGAPGAAQENYGQSIGRERPASSWRAPERDPELVAARRAPAVPQPQGGLNHGDEEHPETAPPAWRTLARAIDATAAEAGRGDRAAGAANAPAKRWFD